MITVNIRADTQPFVNRMNDIKRGLGDRALVSALNKTIAQSKTRMQRAITAEYMVSASLVRERLRIARASRKGGVTFTATLIGNPDSGGAKRALNLIHFVERKVTIAEAKRRRKSETLAHIRFKIKRSGGLKTILGSTDGKGAAFIANQGRTVFRRTGRSRLPIEAVTTVGVPQMFNTIKNIEMITAFMETTFGRVFESEAKYYLSTVK